MSLQETRQLGIEVERRLQVILPTLLIEHKIDTEDIYSFLNQYLDIYIDQIFAQDDQILSNTRAATIAEDVLRLITKNAILTGNQSNNTYDTKNKIFSLPGDYYQYIRSTSKVSSTYSKAQTDTYVSNILVKQSEADQIINQSYDQHRILRNPIVVIQDNTLKVIHDDYTNIINIDLVYIKRPNHFSVLTDTPCDLPLECFENLVEGAVQLYISHLTATQPKERPRRKETEE